MLFFVISFIPRVDAFGKLQGESFNVNAKEFAKVLLNVGVVLLLLTFDSEP